MVGPRPGALSDVRVLDVASMMAGPYCATLLGDMGADVIKLEPPAGDESRRIGPRNETDSGVFVGVNRNKRSIVADLRTEHGQLVLDRLVGWADIVVDNLRPSARRRLGLDYDSLRARDPAVISVSVSTYGSSGPYAGRPGIDPVAQALSGFMNVTGLAGSGPLKAGPPVADGVCSLLAAFGAVTALHSRARTGRGQQVEVALIDGLVHIQAPYTGQYFLLGTEQPRTGNAIGWYAPYNAYRCADDRYVHVACYNDKFFGNLCRALGRPELIDDAAFRTNQARLDNRDRLDAVIATELGRMSREQALARLWDHDVIVGPVNGYAEVFSDPQVVHNGMVVEVPHHAGPLKVTGVPVHLSETPGEVRLAPPALGEHTEEIMRELGITGDAGRGSAD